MAAPLSVEVEFGGGAELLFDGVKKHQVTLPGQEEPWDIRNLLVWIKKNLLKERPELFIQGDSVRNRAGTSPCARDGPSSAIHLPGRGGPQDALPSPAQAESRREVSRGWRNRPRGRRVLSPGSLSAAL
uniref:Ubiquitin-related modifier 1 n=1 Tax=Equus caballus TaxID=9796 RepID=A0A9L0RRA8_HORSE